MIGKQSQNASTNKRASAENIGSEGISLQSPEMFRSPIQQQAGGAVIQRAILETPHGFFHDELYNLKDTADSAGVDMLLSFRPKKSVNAPKIGLVQSVRSYKSNNPIFWQPGQEARTVPDGEEGAGYRIDRISTANNPVYGSDDLDEDLDLKETPKSNAPDDEVAHPEPGESNNATYTLGARTANKVEKAKLYDTPHLDKPALSAGQEFETTALGLDGWNKDDYFGSVRWGWQSNAMGVVSKIDFTKVSDGDPSDNFTEAAKKWNENTESNLKEIESEDDANKYFKTQSDVEVDFLGVKLMIKKGVLLESCGDLLYEIKSPSFKITTRGLVISVHPDILKNKSIDTETETKNSAEIKVKDDGNEMTMRLGNKAQVLVRTVDESLEEYKYSIVVLKSGQLTNVNGDTLLIFLNARDALGSGALPIAGAPLNFDEI
jgi:hypothetical protein